MRYVLGIYPEATYEGGDALPRHARAVFEGFGTQIGGYFDLIAPHFECFSESQCMSSLGALNVLVVLGEAELPQAISTCQQLEVEFSKLEDSWQYHQGSQQSPGQPERQIYVTLRKRRLIGVLRWLEQTFELALRAQHCVVFGSGVCLRMLLGVKLSPGIEVYS